jgi:hypothetical protein
VQGQVRIQPDIGLDQFAEQSGDSLKAPEGLLYGGQRPVGEGLQQFDIGRPMDRKPRSDLDR